MQALTSPAFLATAPVEIRELHRDERGAVMVVGLGMACFLIGSLWFMIGVGNAVVFRDLMQEASDSAAFTSAVIHAKGMNFISAINCILLILFSAYILMGVLNDIHFFVCLVFWLTCPSFIAYHNGWSRAAQALKYGADVAHYVELAVSYGYPWFGTYKASAVASDYGKFSPTKRDVTTWALSTSNIPGALISAPLNRAILALSPDAADPEGSASEQDGNGGGANAKPEAKPDAKPQASSPSKAKRVDTAPFASPPKKKGLPVEAKSWRVLCEKFGGSVSQATIGKLIGKSISKPVSTFIAKGVALRYCNDLGNSWSDDLGGAYTASQVQKFNDNLARANEENAAKAQKDGTSFQPAKLESRAGKSTKFGGQGSILGSVGVDISIGSGGGGLDPGLDSWWGKDGPLMPWSAAGNGTPWHQIWALNFSPEYLDESEHRTAIAARKFDVKQSAAPMLYVSQSEFYYDCKGSWGDDSCNEDDNAGYTIRWRARLVRLQFPAVSLLSSFASDFLVHMNGYRGLTEKITNAAANKATKAGVPALGSNALSQTIKTAVEQETVGRARGEVTSGAASGDRAINGVLQKKFGMYH